MASLGHAGSHTSQLMQSSLIFSDMGDLQPATGAGGGPRRHAARTGTASAGMNELVVDAGGLDRGADALVVLGGTDEDHLDALHRALVHLLEGGDDDVGHRGGLRRGEGDEVAFQHAALHGQVDLFGQALALALVALALRTRQVVDVRAVGDVAHVAADHVGQVGGPLVVVVGGRRGERSLLDGLLLLFGGALVLAGGQHRQRKAGEEHQACGRVHRISPLWSCLWCPGRSRGEVDGAAGAPAGQPSPRCHCDCSACATAGVTKLDTSPPSREISRTREDEMKLYCSEGVRNRVSTSGIRWRFMLASWNSYSKSDTARSPRSSTPPPTSETKCASSESNPRTSTWGWCASASRASS